MGQKVNPTGLRLGVNRTWDSRWYAGKKEYGKLLQEDIKIREYLSDKLKAAGVSRIVIERPHKKGSKSAPKAEATEAEAEAKKAGGKKAPAKKPARKPQAKKSAKAKEKA